jgi:hypothetical protein
MSHADWIRHIRGASLANCHVNVANGQKDSGVQDASLFFCTRSALAWPHTRSPCSGTSTPSSIAPTPRARAHPPVGRRKETRTEREHQNKMGKMTGGRKRVGRDPHACDNMHPVLDGYGWLISTSEQGEICTVVFIISSRLHHTKALCIVGSSFFLSETKGVVQLHL